MTNCPSCDATISPRATSCRCGWNAGGAAPRSGRPSIRVLESSLMAYVAPLGHCHGLPPDPAQAARSWIARCEPERPEERPYLAGPPDRQAWVWPYADRVIYLLRRYLTLPAHERDQVDGGGEDGCHWRGEPPTQYLDMLAQYEESRADPAVYRARVVASIRRYTAKAAGNR